MIVFDSKHKVKTRKHKHLGRAMISLLCIVAMLGGSFTKLAHAEETTNLLEQNTDEADDKVLEGGMVESTAIYPEEPEIYGKAAITSS